MLAFFVLGLPHFHEIILVLVSCVWQHCAEIPRRFEDLRPTGDPRVSSRKPTLGATRPDSGKGCSESYATDKAGAVDVLASAGLLSVSVTLREAAPTLL